MLVFTCVTTGAVNVQVIEGKNTEFVLQGCSRFFCEASVPKILFPDDDGALTLAFSRGEINLQDLSGSLYKSKGILFEKCAPQAHSGHGKVERMIKSLQESFSRSGASNCRLTATGWCTIAKGLEREINDTPIGFLFDKTAAGGNPLLRILRPSTLKGMNASDRAPVGLFSVPDLPERHFNKVKECYNLWFKCWSISYLPLILKSQIWHEDDESLNVNDIVYFKLKESPMKAEWRVGKVDNVKPSRDGKVRQVNIAYKILKEDSNSWSHSVVTRPVREIVKLYEIGDTTYAEDMALVRQTAVEILMKRGSVKEDDRSRYVENKINMNTVASQESRIGVSTSEVDDKNLGADQSISVDRQADDHLPFLQCISSSSWLESSSSGPDFQFERDLDDNENDTYDDLNEMIFLI